jgi:hypothetical protein
MNENNNGLERAAKEVAKGKRGAPPSSPLFT